MLHKEILVRITQYYRILNRLRALGLEKVFAHNLGDATGVSAAVVRKDFSQLAIFGQKRGGYEIADLVRQLGDILGKKEPQHAIIVGCGRIGKALMHYSGFEPDNIRVIAGFDTDPLVYGETNLPTPIYPMARLEEIVSSANIQVAILTVPESATADSYQRLLEAGVIGILNFTPVTLKPTLQPNGTIPVVRNINIALELEQIFYGIQANEPLV